MYSEFNQNCTDAEQKYNGTKPLNSTTTPPYPTTTIRPSTIPPTYLYTNSSIVSISTGTITDSAGKVTVTKSTVYNSKPTVFTTTQGGSQLVETLTGVVTIQTSMPDGGSDSKTMGAGISKASTAASTPSGGVTGDGVRVGGWNFLGVLGMGMVFVGLIGV